MVTMGWAWHCPILMFTMDWAWPRLILMVTMDWAWPRPIHNNIHFSLIHFNDDVTSSWLQWPGHGLVLY